MGSRSTRTNLHLGAIEDGQETAMANYLPWYIIYGGACLQHTWTATRGRGTLSRRVRLTGQHSPRTRHSVALLSHTRDNLKVKCHEIFCFRFFSWIIFFQAPEIFFANSRRYSQLKVHHWYQGWCCWYRRCTLSCEYLCESLKKFETALMVHSGAWEKLIHKKPEVENLVALSL